MHHVSSEQAKRFAVFRIDEDDLARLRACAPFAEQRLPGLLDQWNARFSEWPEIQSALMHPSVHAVRVAHWVRVASGKLDDGFMQSAERLAAIFYENGVPGYAVAICHSTVVNGICGELGLDGTGQGRNFLRRKNDDGVALKSTLNKIAWFDLEVLLETYAKAEKDNKRKAVNELAGAFENRILGIVGSVASAAQQVDDVVGPLSENAARSTDASASVAAAAEQAAASVSSVAMSAEQLEHAIQEISVQVSQSQAVASEAAERSRKTTATIGSLAKAVEKIGAVVSLISNIAAQTNLLALNATIESARAGEAGRGFAVVASEVKTLAGQTAKATEEISAQIAGMQDITSASVEAIDGISEIIDRINTASLAISSAVEEQSASTREIARNTQDVSSGNRQVSDLILGVKSDAAGTADLARQVTDASRSLGSQAEGLQNAVVEFLREIRAA